MTKLLASSYQLLASPNSCLWKNHAHSCCSGFVATVLPNIAMKKKFSNMTISQLESIFHLPIFAINSFIFQLEKWISYLTLYPRDKMWHFLRVFINKPFHYTNNWQEKKLNNWVLAEDSILNFEIKSSKIELWHSFLAKSTLLHITALKKKFPIMEENLSGKYSRRICVCCFISRTKSLMSTFFYKLEIFLSCNF